MRLSHLALPGLVLLLGSCGSEPETNEYTNRDSDKTKATQIAQTYYQNILDKDTVAMHRFFAKDIDSYVSSLAHTILERDTAWGKLVSFTITENETRVLENTKTDTAEYNITLQALYEYGQSEDILYLRKVGNGNTELVNYDFDHRLIMDCSKEEMEKINPVFIEMVEQLVKREDEKIKHWFEPDTAFFRKSIDIRDEFFPADQLDEEYFSVEYNNGYLRQYCGSRNSSNGFLTYKVTLNDSTEIYLTLVVRKFSDETVYDIYTIHMGGYDGYNQETDVTLAKQLCKEIFRMLDRNDYKAFFNALHEEAQLKTDGTAFTETELQDMVTEYHSWGNFESFWQITTFSLNIEDDEDMIRYVAIAKMIDEEGTVNYVELTFKPDSSGKLKLMGYEYMS